MVNSNKTARPPKLIQKGELVQATSGPWGWDEGGSGGDICTKPTGKSRKKNVVPSEPKVKVQGGGTLEPSPETRYGTT